MPSPDLNESLKKCCDALKRCGCEHGEQESYDSQPQHPTQENPVPPTAERKVEPIPLLSEMDKYKAR